MYTLLSGPMVYTLFPCFPRKVVYTIAFLLCDLGVGRQTEKRGVPRWWCILFFPLGLREVTCLPIPEDPKIENFQYFCPGLIFSRENKTFNRECNFQDLQSRMKFSSEPHSKGPNCGEFSRSRLKFSSENEVFKRE